MLTRLQAYHHTASSLTSPTNKGASARPHHIIQVSAGWSHSACLTSAGEVYLWFPFSDDYKDSLTADDQLHGPLRPASPASEDATEGSGRDLKWGQVGGSIVRSLDPLPERPALHISPDVPDRGQDQKARRKAKDAEWAEYESQSVDLKAREDGNKVVKIASGADFLVALKANGEVWACPVRDGDVGIWIYVSSFSTHHL